MNEYIGKTCPYCKTPFKPEDDIIVCSECEMPHHKDCWVENQGCTTFGCLGTIQTANNSASSVTATHMNYDVGYTAGQPENTFVFCGHCGAKNERSSAFCPRCGSRLNTTPERTPQPPVYTQANPNNSNPYAYVSGQGAAQQTQSAYQSTPYQAQNAYQSNPYQAQNTYQSNPYQAQNTYQAQGTYQGNPYQAQSTYQSGGYNAYQSQQSTSTDTEVQQLIGVKAEYYLPKFQLMRLQYKTTSWNWAAFLVTPYWMMYRKMYGYAAAVLAVDIIVSLIGSPALSLLALAGYIVFGCLGNSIYMNFLEGKAIQAKGMQEPYKSQFILANGGVNTTATVLAIVGRIVLIGILLG